MSNYVTIVIRMPTDTAEKQRVNEALSVLRQHQTAMSLEDEMTVLEMIEQHEDFADYIADEARDRAAKLHAEVEAA